MHEPLQDSHAGVWFLLSVTPDMSYARTFISFNNVALLGSNPAPSAILKAVNSSRQANDQSISLILLSLKDAAHRNILLPLRETGSLGSYFHI